MSQDLIYQAFGEDADLYTTVLDAKPDSTATQLRKAYYRRALIFHPDKNQEDEEAKLKFQAVSLAYEILSDPERRKEYDETGELNDDDDLVGGGVSQWESYFRGLFKRVSVDDINKFESEYKGSDEERKDVLKYYKKCKGNLDEMLTCVMLSEEKDKKRWVDDFINPAVKNGEVKWYKEAVDKTLGDNDEDTVTDDDGDDVNENKAKKKKTTKNDSKKKRRAKAQAKKEKEANEAEELLAKIRGNAMARREKAFGAMMQGLEEHYSGKRKRGASKKVEDDPIPDDEFEQIQARIESNRNSKNASSKRRKT